MTAYFDRVSHRLDSLRRAGEFRSRPELLDELEQELVFDVTVAAELPDFPADLRTAVHEAVLRHGISTLPLAADPADFETEEEHVRRLQDLQGDLHTIFHEVGIRCFPRLSDDPRRGILLVAARGEEEREKIVERRRYGPVRERAQALGWRRAEDPWPVWTDPNGNVIVRLDPESACWRTRDPEGEHREEGGALLAALGPPDPTADPPPAT